MGLIQGRLRLTVLLGPFLLQFHKSIIQELHKCLRHFLEKKPRKDKPSRDWRERRNAIRLTNEHTVETLVVADANMVQYHGAEAAQRFILTVMNMVSPERVLPLVGSDFPVSGALEAGVAPLSPGKEAASWGSRPVTLRADAVSGRKSDSEFSRL